MGPEPKGFNGAQAASEPANPRHAEGGAIAAVTEVTEPAAGGTRQDLVNELRGALRAALAEARDQRSRADVLESENRALAATVRALEGDAWGWRDPSEPQEHGPYATRDAALEAARRHLVAEVRQNAGADVSGAFYAELFVDQLVPWLRLKPTPARIRIEYEVRPGQERDDQVLAAAGAPAVEGNRP